MDTLQEALFRDMLNNDWFTQSDGDVESPTGYFGYVVNAREDWSPEFQSVFQETVSGHGLFADELTPDNEKWIQENFCGVYSASINSDGIISIYRHGDYVRTPGVAVLGIEATVPVRGAQRWYRGELQRFAKWSEEKSEHVANFYKETGAGDPAEFYKNGGGTTRGDGGF